MCRRRYESHGLLEDNLKTLLQDLFISVSADPDKSGNSGKSTRQVQVVMMHSLK